MTKSWGDGISKPMLTSFLKKLTWDWIPFYCTTDQLFEGIWSSYFIRAETEAQISDVTDRSQVCPTVHGP